MNFSRGDVVTVLFPHSNLRTATARPVLIVQRDGLGTGLDQIIVAMITRNMTRAGHPSRVTVLVASEEGKQSGLRGDSVIMLDNLATVRDTQIDRTIGRLATVASVDTALRHALAL